MQVSVLHWNVWVNEDIRNVSEFLKARPADIICLQELTINHANQTEKNTPQFIANQLGYHYFVAPMPWHDEAEIAVGIFSRFPIVSSRKVFINQPTGSGGYDDEYRAYAEVTLDIEGKTLTVGTTHMSYTHKFKMTEHKRAETDRLVAEIAKNNQNYIFTGDLNATHCSYTYRKIRSHLRSAGPYFWHKTWTTKPFSYDGFETTKRRWRLDHIFTSKDVKKLSAQVEKTEFSDHLPIRATLQIKA
jgi:endonuclease/exonuclease/phosphatase family metal-dependent hydrolase